MASSGDGCRLQRLVFEECGVSAPLDEGFAEALDGKLRHGCPFEELRLTCQNSNKSGGAADVLRDIWTTRWQDLAVCCVEKDHISLKLSD